jgi:hypothetical protein
MSDFDQLEALLASGDHVRLPRRQAQDVLQKLRARGGKSDAADRIEAQLASGRRWVFGSDEPREHEPPRATPPEREPEPEPESGGWLSKWLRR